MDELLTNLSEDYLNKYDCRLKYILDDYSIKTVVEHIMKWLDIEWKETDTISYFDVTTIARDFYIGSDLSENEKNIYFEELVKQSFFKKLDSFLYSNDFYISSWTIYTIGKFSHSENSHFLEKAYEKNFILTNPILSYRCLNELRWLKSPKLKSYLSELDKSERIASKITLLLYWNTSSNKNRIRKILEDKNLKNFISPKNPKGKIEKIINKLYQLEFYISNYYIENKEINYNIIEFENLAEKYFLESEDMNSSEEIDEAHNELVKNMRGK